MSGVSRLVAKDNKGTKKPTNEQIKAKATSKKK